MDKDGKSSISLAFFVARRYLFSKKSHNVINLISAVSAAGVAVVSMALVCVLSVFNGFENLVGELYSAFDPDLKIAPAQGKHFDISTPEIQKVIHFEEIKNCTEVVQDNALLRYGSRQMPATVKGVSPAFEQMTRIDSVLFDGHFELFDGAFERSVVGLGVASGLSVNPNFYEPLLLYAPRRTERVNILRPDQSLTQTPTFVSGIFSIRQPQYDENYVLVSLVAARNLFGLDSTEVSALEIQLQPDVNAGKTKKLIQNTLGENYTVKNRIEQQESFFRILEIEKWIASLILIFILLIASFNIIGSLSMLIIDKTADIQTLKSLGADRTLVRRIFLLEGWLISIVGATVGIALGAVLCLAQQHLGFIRMGENYVVDIYPVILHSVDVCVVFAAVVVLGFLAALYPSRYAAK